jgi:hypothetical protein
MEGEDLARSRNRIAAINEGRLAHDLLGTQLAISLQQPVCGRP